MKQVLLIEELCFCDKNGNDLVISKWIEKGWFPIDSEREAFELGLHRIEQNQLNKLNITFQDESKLQCVIFHKYDFENYLYGSSEYIVSELKRLTGRNSVTMTNILIHGKNYTDMPYIPLRYDIYYKYIFNQFDYLRDYRVGQNIVAHTFQNGVSTDIPKNTETIIITDSYIENMDFLRNIENLKSLVIERCVVGNWDYVSRMNKMENLFLETVDLPDSMILRNMAYLKRLSLADCNLQEIEGLCDKTALQFCDLSNNAGLETIDSLKNSVELKWLSIENTSIDILDLNSWGSLNVLELYSNSFSKLNNISNCQDLKLLDYSYNRIEKATMLEIFHLVRKNKLIAFDALADIDLIFGLN